MIYNRNVDKMKKSGGESTITWEYFELMQSKKVSAQHQKS